MQRKDTIGDRGRPITHAPGHKMHASVGRPNCLRRGELRPASWALALTYLSRQAVVGVGLVHPGEDLGAAEAGELPGMHAGEVRSWSAGLGAWAGMPRAGDAQWARQRVRHVASRGAPHYPIRRHRGSDPCPRGNDGVLPGRIDSGSGVRWPSR